MASRQISRHPQYLNRIEGISGQTENNKVVYFFGGNNEHGEPLVKIGFTDRQTPQQRLLECQTGSPVKLEILGFIPGGRRATEQQLHKRFRDVHSHLEWFHLTPIESEIMALAKAHIDGNH